MSAPIRKPLPSPVLPSLHLVQQVRAGRRCFVHTANWWRFVQLLRQASRRHRCAIHAYVLMADQVQLLVTPREEGAAGRMLHLLGSRYVRYFNASTGGDGPLWQGRATAATVAGDAALLDCQRLIELAPLRAGLVASPGSYRWSSYRHNALGDHDPLVVPHARYLRLARTDADRRLCWQALVAAGAPVAV